MVRVLLSDLLAWRRAVGGAVLCAVAAYVALHLDVAVPGWVYPVGVVATTTVSTSLLLAGYYRADRLADYLQLPVPRRDVLLALVATVCLLLAGEVLAPVVTFGLVSGTLTGAGALGCAAAQGATVAAVVAWRTLAGPHPGWAAAAAGAALLGLVAVVRGAADLADLAVPVWAVVVAVLAVARLATGPPFHLVRPAPPGRAVRSGNFFVASVAAQRVVVANGVLLTGFAVLFSVISRSSGILLPVAFAVVAVSSPFATLLSADRDTTATFRMLGRPRSLVRQYVLCAVAWFGAANAALLGAYAALGWPGLARLAVLAVLTTVVEAAAVPLLEVRFPIRRWSTPRDVWRHPRKYLVPAVVLVVTTLVAAPS